MIFYRIHHFLSFIVCYLHPRRIEFYCNIWPYVHRLRLSETDGERFHVGRRAGVSGWRGQQPLSIGRHGGQSERGGRSAPEEPRRSRARVGRVLRQHMQHVRPPAVAHTIHRVLVSRPLLFYVVVRDVGRWYKSDAGSWSVLIRVSVAKML